MNRQLSICIGLILFIIGFANSLNAEVFRPIQLFLPGNFRGTAVNLSENYAMLPSPCWKAPSIISSFRKFSRDAVNLVYGIGNDASIHSVTSFVSDGLPSQRLLSACQPDAIGTAPEDMMIFRNRLLDREFRRRILTNLESEAETSVFPSHHFYQKDGLRVWFFNFIGDKEFASLPLQNWSQIKPENPARSLRRLSPNISNEDLTISTIHMEQELAQELIKELNNFPGYHLIVDVAESREKALFSTITPDRQDKTFCISVCDGINKLPMLKIIRRNHGYPRVSLKMLPYAKAEPGNSQIEFNRVKNEMTTKLHETLTMIPTSIRPSTAPFRFNPYLVAKFACSQMNTDLAIIDPVPETHKRDNVISPAIVFSSMPNEKMYSFRTTGIQLEKIIRELLNSAGNPAPIFSGISFSYLGKQVKEIHVGKFPLQKLRSYSIAINQRLLHDKVYAKTLLRCNFEPFDGTTLWDIWKNQLKSLRINKEHLLD